MATSLRITFLTPTGFDWAAFEDSFDDFTLTADNGSTARYTDGAGSEVLVHYALIGGIVHITGFDVTQNGETLVSGTYTEPVTTSLDYFYITMNDLMDTILPETTFGTRGSGGDDVAATGENADRMALGEGADSAEGGQGGDLMLGGADNDYLSGLAGGDRLGGGAGQDLIATGKGNDTAFGGDGNDVILLADGFDVARGGAGADLFVIQGFASHAGGSPNIDTAHIQDFDLFDVIVIGGYQVLPEFDSQISGTLADLENGTVDDFQWRQTAAGVEILAGDALIQLAGIMADQLDLDRLYFTSNDVDDIADLFFAETGSAGLGTSAEGDAFLAFGGSETGVILADGEIINTFQSGASGDPNV